MGKEKEDKKIMQGAINQYFGSIKVFLGKHLPKNTVVVSEDVFKDWKKRINKN